MISDLVQLRQELRSQRQVLEDLLAALRCARIAGAPLSSPPADRKNFLALLSESLDKVRRNRNAWLRLDPAQKQDHPEITELLRESQNLILKILVLDRENEASPVRSAPKRAAAAEPVAVPESSHLLTRIYGRKPAS